MRSHTLLLAATLAIVGCSDASPGSTTPPDDAAPDGARDVVIDAPQEASVDVAPDAPDEMAPDAASLDGPDDVTLDAPMDAPADLAPLRDVPRTEAGCVAGALVDEIARCIDGGSSPDACLARATADVGAPLCDADSDGLGDDFEDALQRAYAMAFAFNQGNGTSAFGDPESCWPDNVAHYIADSRLIWRVDNDARTTVVVAESITPAMLGVATVTAQGALRTARDPSAGNGANFWLCLRMPGGRYDPSTTLDTMARSLALSGGIDLAGVVHPANGPGDTRYVFVASVLYYAYNRHSLVDDHEGDWEGGGVLVDRSTGAVVAAYFDRHPSVDNQRLVVVGPAGSPALDPSRESSPGDLCDEAAARRVRGVRFWDWSTLRHHAVVFVSAGGHASYDMPGNTKILGVGCGIVTAPRDTHNGDGAKLLPWLGGFARTWGGAITARPVGGVNLRNLGEDDRPRIPWAAYHGQWGCQHETVAKSYPGPWDNARHCRRWITHRWGTAVPFVTANPSADCTGAP